MSRLARPAPRKPQESAEFEMMELTELPSTPRNNSTISSHHTDRSAGSTPTESRTRERTESPGLPPTDVEPTQDQDRLHGEPSNSAPSALNAPPARWRGGWVPMKSRTMRTSIWRALGVLLGIAVLAVSAAIMYGVYYTADSIIDSIDS